MYSYDTSNISIIVFRLNIVARFDEKKADLAQWFQITQSHTIN